MGSTAHFIARSEIADVLAIHSRGVDRGDANLLAAAYHADASVDYGFFSGPASELVQMLASAQKTAPPTHHRTSVGWVRCRNGTAVAESYVVAYVEEPGIQRLVFGRYLDRFVRKDGAWRIAHRQYVLDANINRRGDAIRADPPVQSAHFVPSGAKGASDAGRALLTLHHAATRHLKRAEIMPPEAEVLDAALSRDAIRTLLSGYCRGVDRADPELLASLFWEDATVISGVINGPAPAFAQGIAAYVSTNLDACFHSVANEWIELSGDHGVGEVYVLAHTRGAGQETLTGGRYIDRYERRVGTWRIASRVFVCDWTSTQPSTFESDGFYASLTTRGCFGRNDPVYAHWSKP